MSYKKIFLTFGSTAILMFSLVACSSETNQSQIEQSTKEVQSEVKTNFKEDMVYYKYQDIELYKVNDELLDKIAAFREKEYKENGVDYIPKEIGLLNITYSSNGLYYGSTGERANICVEKVTRDVEKITIHCPTPSEQSLQIAYNNYMKYALRDKNGKVVKSEKTDFRIDNKNLVTCIDFYSKDIEKVKWLELYPYIGRIETEIAYFVE